MKTILLKSKLTLMTVLGCVSLTTPANAVVTWIVTEDGSGVTMTTEGFLSMPAGTFGGVFTSDVGFVGDNGSSTGLRNGEVGYLVGAGTFSGNDPYIVGALTPVATTFSGSSFQYSTTTLYLPSATDTSSAYVVTPTSTMTFNLHTISSLFDTNLDGGPVTLWTANGTGDTIQVALAAIPEPSSIVLFGLSGLALIMRRKR